MRPEISILPDTFLDRAEATRTYDDFLFVGVIIIFGGIVGWIVGNAFYRRRHTLRNLASLPISLETLGIGMEPDQPPPKAGSFSKYCSVLCQRHSGTWCLQLVPKSTCVGLSPKECIDVCGHVLDQYGAVAIGRHQEPAQQAFSHIRIRFRASVVPIQRDDVSSAATAENMTIRYVGSTLYQFPARFAQDDADCRADKK